MAYKKHINIALAGYSGSGKSTVAGLLSDFYYYSEFAFANHLKDCLIQYCGVEREYFYNPKLKDKPLSRLGGHTPRTWLTTFSKYIGPLNTELIAQFAEDNINWKRPTVISDLRFKTELRFVLKRNFKIIGVEKPTLEKKRLHEDLSETTYPYIKEFANIVIVNDGSIDNLKTATILAMDILNSQEESNNNKAKTISASKGVLTS